MRYTCLGHTGLKVSKLCLGTMNFGSRTNEEESFKIMERAVELGINFFDTANFYGNPAGKGVTETIIGNWFAVNKTVRNELVLASKAYATMGTGVNDRGLSAYHLRKECDAALSRMQTGHIDLWQMHHIDRGVRGKGELANIGLTEEFDLEAGLKGNYSTGWNEIWQAMELLIQQGKITYTGSANFAAWNIVMAHMNAQKRNMLGIVSEQSIYNLMNRNIEREVIPACSELGIGILPYSPLNGGLLSGLQKEGMRARVEEMGQDVLCKMESYEKLCNETGISAQHMALAWLLHQPAVTSVIIGPRTLEQLEDNVKVLDIKLNSEILEKLNEIWPSPGDAPEAYSW